MTMESKVNLKVKVKQTTILNSNSRNTLEEGVLAAVFGYNIRKSISVKKEFGLDNVYRHTP